MPLYQVDFRLASDFYGKCGISTVCVNILQIGHFLGFFKGFFVLKLYFEFYVYGNKNHGHLKTALSAVRPVCSSSALLAAHIVAFAGNVV